MQQRSRLVRTAWLFGAALQLALPGAAAWADVRLDAPAAHATAHIESHSTQSCARIHPPDCALCHYLTAPVVTSRPAADPFATAVERRARGVVLGAPRHPRARTHPQPRAPPALS
jgi:hypothetical protein